MSGKRPDWESLVSLAEVLVDARTLRDVARAVADHLGGRFDADGAGVFSLEGDHFRHLAASDPEEDERFRDFRVPLDQPSLVRVAAESGTVVSSPDFLRDPRVSRRLVEITGIRAATFAPLMTGGRAVGALYLAHRKPHPPPGDDEIRELEVVARQAAVALERAVLLRELPRSIAAAERSARQLRERRDELERLIFLVSHDLRTPVVSIQNFLHYLEAEFEDRLPEQARFYLGRIAANCEHLNNLIRGILDLSQVGRGEPMEERVELDEVVAEVLASLEPRIREAGATIDVGPLPVVTGNRTRLLQIFQNLIGNALTYGVRDEGRGPTVKVGAEETESGWRISVWNDGPPIPEEATGRIFELFYRLPEAVERNPRGSGAGLAIVKRIVEAHGGEVGAEPTGDGTLFWFTLPRRAVPARARGRGRR